MKHWLHKGVLWCYASVIWCLLIRSWMTVRTYGIILIALPLQQWLKESASVLRHTYIACLALLLNIIFLALFVLKNSLFKYRFRMLRLGRKLIGHNWRDTHCHHVCNCDLQLIFHTLCTNKYIIQFCTKFNMRNTDNLLVIANKPKAK